ncbi:arsenate reductase-like glutaredoxin family protein [Chryseobacterium sp. PvR013]|uniref:ATP-binding protein n=1 Tax=Chryseobacterium sp. PvR013 TaxID=2806595 RepID=UPI001AE9A4EC|nr:ATP-binding protein [Chryseobacterium sp. PvR013]MBP1167633.1 arsenate reductase-like glutaredoxin family protein [Chryseobacterium sp. PvR013]
MKTTSERITTNTRVIKSHFTKYGDTFKAFKELINNSIQADAKNISIDITYNPTITCKSGIEKISITDDGHGVSKSNFKTTILEIGTNVKNNGQGIGRFSSFQIGELMKIDTVAYDEKESKFSKTVFGIDTTDLEDIALENVDLKIDYDFFENSNENSYYKVEIENLHHNIQHKPLKKNRITNNFLLENIGQSLFENYPYEIFNSKVNFTINGNYLKKEDFVAETPSFKQVIYIDKRGKNHEINFYFYNIKSQLNKVKVFFQTDNAGVKSVAHEYTYSSDWYTPDLGTWFIYVDSNFFDIDLFRNLDIESLGEEEIKNLKSEVKNTINEFFKNRNKKFEKFITSLESDKYYPYREERPASDLQEIVFKKIAYLLEDEHHLIQSDNKIRTFLYPLLDKTISNGNIEYIFSKILKLSDENLEKFNSLLQKTELEDVIHFASQVSEKLEFLNFLHEIIYGEISNVLKERSQLHKIIENELWVFGENYNGTPHLWSDKKIGNILDELHSKFLDYEPTKDDENLIEENNLDDITDLFFYNEKITDSDEKEIMIVELKSPKCAIGLKELNQIDRYAFTLEQHSALPSDKVKYKLILVSSRLNAYAKSKVKSQRELYRETPYLFDKKTERNIEVYVMSWAEIIELNKRKLGYLHQQLEIKDKSVKEKFEEEYPQLIDEKVHAQLRIVG